MSEIIIAWAYSEGWRHYDEAYDRWWNIYDTKKKYYKNGHYILSRFSEMLQNL